jgi:hypothetical protein
VDTQNILSGDGLPTAVLSPFGEVRVRVYTQAEDRSTLTPALSQREREYTLHRVLP